jgi:hypothetical protein
MDRVQHELVKAYLHTQSDRYKVNFAPYNSFRCRNTQMGSTPYFLSYDHKCFRLSIWVSFPSSCPYSNYPFSPTTLLTGMSSSHFWDTLRSVYTKQPFLTCRTAPTVVRHRPTIKDCLPKACRVGRQKNRNSSNFAVRHLMTPALPSEYLACKK